MQMKLIRIFLIIFLALSLTNSRTPLRGVWLTISGTRSPYTKQGIQKVVSSCKVIGINTIYFAVWDESMLNFQPAKSLTDKYPELKMNPGFSFDPLQYLIQVAKQAGIKVLGWFEYGFATSYNDPTGGPILRSRPKWQAKDQTGSIATKNNFQWMNGFLPQVQQFIIDIIVSLGQTHQIDGFQGDDRLPAMPSLAGYDQYTIELYKKEHSGKQPPVDVKDNQWVQWRCDILNRFMKNLSMQFRGRFPKLEIHMAPSVYPWSKSQYLQDWPQWIKNDWIDIVIPQIYRYSVSAYIQTLQQNKALLSSQKQDRIFAGMLIGVGSNTTVNAKILSDCLQANRQLGILGESFFYHESLFDVRVAQIIGSFYH